MTDTLAHADARSLAVALGIALITLCALGFALFTALLRYRNRRHERRWRAREERWGPVLIDVLAGTAPPDALHLLVDERERLYFVDYLLRYARRLRGESRRTLALLAEPHLAPVAERLRGGDAERRARAVETLALLGFATHAERIVGALDDPSPLVAAVAARGVARNRAPEHLPALLAHLPRLRLWSPRQVAALLASMGGEALPPLRAALADAALSAEVRTVVADALRALRDPEAADAAAALLTAPADREVTAASLRLLAEVGRPEHAELVRPLCESPDELMRAMAMRALATTGAAVDHDRMRDGVGDDSLWVALQAARALRDSGGDTELRALAGTGHFRADLAHQVLSEQP